jgi:hypothetical protein
VQLPNSDDTEDTLNMTVSSTTKGPQRCGPFVTCEQRTVRIQGCLT